MIHARFGEWIYTNPLADLRKVYQIGSLLDYMEAFEVCAHKLTISEEDILSMFISGLQDDIGYPVLLHGPKTLQQAYSQARIQDAYLQSQKSGKQPFTRHPFAKSATPITPGKPPLLPTPQLPRITAPNAIAGKTTAKFPAIVNPSKVRRLTEAEMADKRAKNQCFWCEERFTPNHKCTKKYLNMIVECPEEEGERGIPVGGNRAT